MVSSPSLDQRPSSSNNLLDTSDTSTIEVSPASFLIVVR